MGRFYFTILCVAISLSGCQIPDSGVDEAPSNGRTTLTAKTLQLKISTPEGVQESEIDHTWNTTSHIGVFGKEGGGNAKYSLFNSYDGAAEGLFYGAEVKGDVYAYYPYNKDVTADGSKILLTIPDTQTYNSSLLAQFEQHNKLYVAKSTDGIVDFGYLYGCLGIRIKGDFNVHSVTLSCDNQPLAGRIAFDFENDMKASASARSLYSLTIGCDEALAASEGALLYALLPPATYSNLTIKVKTDKGEISKRLNGSYSVKRVTSTICEETMSSGTIDADFERLTIGELSETEPRKWKQGAMIGLFSAESNNTLYAIKSESVGAEVAQFVGAAVDGDRVAYYPYNPQTSFAEGKLTIQSGSEQIYNESLLTQFIDATPFMVAKATADEKLSFEYVMGLMAIRVKANVDIKYVEVSSSKPLAGKLVVDIDNGYICSEAQSGTKHSITLDVSGKSLVASLDVPRMVYVSLPAGEYDDLSVVVTAEDGETLSAVIADKVTIKRMNISTIAEDITYQTIDVVLEKVAYGKKAWSEGDELSLYNVTREKSFTSPVLSAAGGNTNKVVAVGTPDELYNAVYPASAAKSLNSVATVVFPVEQHYVDGSLAKESHIYVGRSKDGVTQLNLLTSILGIEIVATYDCEISAIDITSKSQPLAGVASVDMNYEEEPAATFVEAKQNIKLVMDTPVKISNGSSKVFYVAIPASLYNAEELSVVVDGSRGATIKDIAVVIPALRAQYNEATLSTIKCTNLTEGGKYANCFVMPNKKGWYMFDAKIKGGYDKDEDGNSVISRSAIAGTLFELNRGMITEVHTCNNAQSVSFYYDGSEGNASIVTIEEGMVLWAWHLWCPCEDQPKDVIIGSNTYLDRNLGSLKVPASKMEMEAMSDADFLASGGMLYQWGRPSPFPYVNSYATDPEAWDNRLGEAKNANTPTYYYPSAALITKASYGSIAKNSSKVQSKFVSTNEVLFKSNASATKAPLLIGCYLNNANDRRWSDEWNMNVSHEKASWNYSVEAHRQYDPCPYGYELPLSEQLAADVHSFFAENNGESYLASQDKGVFKGGHYKEQDGTFHWWPVTGLRYYYGLWGTLGSPNCNVVGASTSTAKKPFVYVNNKTAVARTANTDKWAPVTAMGVRCVKK